MAEGKNLPTLHSANKLAQIKFWYVQAPIKGRIVLSLIGLASLAALGDFFFSQFTQARPPMSLGYSRLMLGGLGIVLFFMAWLVTGQLFKSRWLTAIGSLVFALALALVLDWWAPRPKVPTPQVVFSADAWHGEVYDTTTLAGIQWQPHYSATTLQVINASAYPVENLDFTITSDAYFVAVAQSSEVADVRIREGIVSSEPLGHFEYKDRKGTLHSFPVRQKAAISKQFHIYCRRLDAHDVLSLVTASVDIANDGEVSHRPRELDFIEVVDGSFETGTIEGTKRFPIKWHHDFRNVRRIDRPDVVKVRLTAFAHEGGQTSLQCFRSGDEAFCKNLRDAWVQRVCDYLDVQLGHSACVQFRSQLVLIDGQSSPLPPPPTYVNIMNRIQAQANYLLDFAKTFGGK